MRTLCAGLWLVDEANIETHGLIPCADEQVGKLLTPSSSLRLYLNFVITLCDLIVMRDMPDCADEQVHPPPPLSSEYRVTSLIRKRHPSRTIVGPQAKAYCRVLGQGVF